MSEQADLNNAGKHRETGVLLFKDHCYALRCSDGAEYWLEMGSSPCHLIESHVAVEGDFHPPNIMFVESIQPV